jgi:putative SOS response-associated peptidase YedK
MSKIHDRMPIMLPPSACDMWLDPELDDQATLGKLLVPAPPEVITFHPVSTDVNNARSRGAELVEPVELDPSDDVRLDDTDPDDDRHGAAAS